MGQLPFDPSAIDYTTRIQQKKAPLSRLRLIVVGKSGARHTFSLYTFSPYFEPQPRHYFSPCGRFVVMRHFTEINGEKCYTGQFHVYYHGNEIPEDRYAIRQAIREKAGRIASRYKHSNGKDEGVSDTDRRRFA